MAALFFLPPFLIWLMLGDWLGGMGSTAYGLALGGMAAAAWASSFPRYRVGAGAVLVMAADLLFLAGTGPLQGQEWVTVMVWPIAYLGQMLLCIGVMQTLRKRDPLLRLVHSRRVH